jgi:phosphoribosylcarboxyaminoimidazole (NCAIR) mutase
MQKRASASRAAIEPVAMLAIGDAKNAGMVDTAICQACRKRLCRRPFRNSHIDRLLREHFQCESPTPPKSRMRGL